MMNRNRRPNNQSEKVGNTGARCDERQNVKGGRSSSSWHNESFCDEKHSDAPTTRPNNRGGKFGAARVNNQYDSHGFSSNEIQRAIDASKTTSKPRLVGGNSGQPELMMDMLIQLTEKVNRLEEKSDANTKKVMDKVQNTGHGICKLINTRADEINELQKQFWALAGEDAEEAPEDADRTLAEEMTMLYGEENSFRELGEDDCA